MASKRTDFPLGHHEHHLWRLIVVRRNPFASISSCPYWQFSGCLGYRIRRLIIRNRGPIDIPCDEETTARGPFDTDCVLVADTRELDIDNVFMFGFTNVEVRLGDSRS